MHAQPDILLVEDHPLFRDGFCGMLAGLRPDWQLRCATTVAEALAAAAQRSPGLAVVDIGLPGGDGFALVEHLAPAPCLLISARDDLAARTRARMCGARGFVAKAEVPERVLEALDRVLAGETAFSADAAAPILLSPRQAEVLALLGEGLGNKEIRYRLNIAERTVRAHLTDLFHLLGVHSRTQAILRARDLGLIG